MNTSPHETEREPLRVELFATPYQRRASVNDHADFLESIATPPAVDPIDELVAELRQVESEVTL